MHGHALIFSRSGGPDRLYRVSPLLYSQREVMNEYFLPDERDLPGEGLDLRFETFDFGFSNPGNIVPPLDMAYFDIPFGRNFLASMITGSSMAAPGPTPPVAGSPNAAVTPSFQFNFVHLNAKGVQRQWSSKPVTDFEALGTAEEPMIFKSPVLILKGDTLQCQLINLANVNLMAQIVLIGGEFE
jgi:hypothetical protein